MEMEVFDCEKAVGLLHVEKTGLYQTVSCSVIPASSGILRLYVWNGTQGACLGVLCPEGGAFTLRKRCSASVLPFAPETAVLGAEDEGFLPWRGTFEGVEVPFGYLKHTPQGDCLATPVVEGVGSAFADRPWQTGTATVAGAQCRIFCPWKTLAPIETEAPREAEETPCGEASLRASPLAETAETEAPEDPVPDEPQTRFHAETVL